MMWNVVAGIANVILVYLVGRRAFEHRVSAILAAAILATTPAYLVQSVQPGTSMLSVTCLLVWMFGVLSVTREDQVWRIFLAHVAAGSAVYAWLGAIVLGPACVAIAFVVLHQRGMRAGRPYTVAVIGLGLAWLPLAAWYLTHAGAFAGQVEAHKLYDPALLNPLQGLRELMSYVSLTERSSVFWDYFSPSYLFFSGQVFWWPLIALLPFGVYRLVADQPSARSALLILGFVSSPLPAALLAQRYTIGRALVMLPFAALVAASGAERLWSYFSASTMRPTASDASRRSGL